MQNAMMHYLRMRNWHCWDYHAKLCLMRTIQGRTELVSSNLTNKEKGNLQCSMQLQ